MNSLQSLKIPQVYMQFKKDDVLFTVLMTLCTLHHLNN